METKSIDAKERTARVYPSKQTTRKFYSPFPNHLWCADLIDMRNYGDENNDYKYILVCIDVYSRYVWMKPLKSKSCDEVIRMLKDCLTDAGKLLKTTGVHPNYIATDEEEAFKKITYNEFKIQRIICQGKYGAAVAESYIREFKKRLSTYFTQRKNHKWIDVYADILDAYNHRKHSVTNRVPIELYTCETESTEKDEPTKLTANDKTQKFQEGDIVRFKYDKSLFKFQKKSLLPSYSKDLFRVQKVSTGPRPVGYKVKRLTKRSQPMDQQNVKHRQEINNADKRLFYWHELKKSNLTANQVKRLGNDSTV